MSERTTTDLRLQAIDSDSPQVAAILITVANWLDGIEKHEVTLNERLEDIAKRAIEDEPETVDPKTLLNNCPECGEFRGHGHVCTPAIDPGEGWELLPVGTLIEYGDEFECDGKWLKSHCFGQLVGRDECEDIIYRRLKRVKALERITPESKIVDLPNRFAGVPSWIAAPAMAMEISREMSGHEPRYQSDVTCSIGASQRESKPPSVNRVPVRLWCMECNFANLGSTVTASPDIPDTCCDWLEIHTDGNGGLYVEVPQ